MNLAYEFKCKAGTFRIARDRRGWWLELGADRFDGPFASEDAALDELIGGHCYWPSPGIDPSQLGLPDDLSDWSFVKA